MDNIAQIHFVLASDWKDPIEQAEVGFWLVIWEKFEAVSLKKLTKFLREEPHLY